jgi:tetratricopeptide (TPR) repeat protein
LKCLIHSPDGGYVVVGSSDGTLTAWNPLNGKQLFRGKLHGSAVRCLSFAPDGSRLATASADRSLKILDPAAWRELLTLHLQDPARSICFSPDGKQLALSTGSLVFLDTEKETARSDQRRLARENDERAQPLVKSVLEKTADPLQARELIISQASTDEATCSAALRRLRESLDFRWADAYQVGKLAEELKLQILRQQLVLRSDRPPSNRERRQLIGSLTTLTNTEAIKRQALAEYASAKLNWWQDGLDTAALAWEIVSNRRRRPDDYLLAYFGMGPVVCQTPQDADCLKTMAMAEYRVGLYAEALETAERGSALSQNANLPAAQYLAVIAMSLRQMGRIDAAVEAMRKLDELMKRPKSSADQESVALNDEVRKVLASPPEKPWNEQAAREFCKMCLVQKFGETKCAIWQAWSEERKARQHFDRGEDEEAESARKKVRTVFEAQLAMSPDDAYVAHSLAAYDEVVESSRIERGRFYISHGQIEKAAADIARAIQAQPENLELRYFQALLRLVQGNQANLRQDCSDLLARYGTATDPQTANSVAWSCALGPIGVADREAALRLAEAALAASPPALKPIVMNTLGAALYRTGQFQESLHWLEEGIRKRGGESSPQDWAFLALTHLQLGHRAEALRWLDRLRTYRQNEDLNAFWNELEIRLLRHEAEASILYDPIFPADPFAH